MSPLALLRGAYHYTSRTKPFPILSGEVRVGAHIPRHRLYVPKFQNITSLPTTQGRTRNTPEHRFTHQQTASRASSFNAPNELDFVFTLCAKSHSHTAQVRRVHSPRFFAWLESLHTLNGMESLNSNQRTSAAKQTLRIRKGFQAVSKATGKAHNASNLLSELRSARHYIRKWHPQGHFGNITSDPTHTARLACRWMGDLCEASIHIRANHPIN